MHKGRLEAFSDGVIAIIITIMVLELKTPHTDELSALIPLVPTLISYAISFVFIGIYWSNHHHLLQAANHVNGQILWANMHLLFWLSLTPFATAWMGDTGFKNIPVAVYGVVLLCSAIAYSILTRALQVLHGEDSVLCKAIGRDFKGKISVIIYIIGIVLSLFYAWAGYTLYILVAIMWLIPDQRIEKVLK